MQLVLANTENSIGGLVGVLDFAIAADHENAFLQCIENRFKERTLARETLHEECEVRVIKCIQPA